MKTMKQIRKVIGRLLIALKLEIAFFFRLNPVIKLYLSEKHGDIVTIVNFQKLKEEHPGVGLPEAIVALLLSKKVGKAREALNMCRLYPYLFDRESLRTVIFHAALDPESPVYMDALAILYSSFFLFDSLPDMSGLWKRLHSLSKEFLPELLVLARLYQLHLQIGFARASSMDIIPILRNFMKC